MSTRLSTEECPWWCRTCRAHHPDGECGSTVTHEPERVEDRPREEMADFYENSVTLGSQCPLCGVTHPHRHTALEIVCYQNGIKWARNSQRVAAEQKRAIRDAERGGGSEP